MPLVSFSISKISTFVCICFLHVTVILFFLPDSDVARTPCIADLQFTEVTDVRYLYTEVFSVEALSFQNASPSYPANMMKKKKNNRKVNSNVHYTSPLPEYPVILLLSAVRTSGTLEQPTKLQISGA